MSRNIGDLHPVLQIKVNQLIDECARYGLKIGISECLRTKEEQDELYAKGRTKAGSIVTNAKGSSYSSMHQWGIAFDFYRNDGTGAYNNNDKFFQKVGAIGKSLGLMWGGDFKSIVDLPHFQLPDWGASSSEIKKKYGTPNEFFKTWVRFRPGYYTLLVNVPVRKSASLVDNKVKLVDCTMPKNKLTLQGKYAIIKKGIKVTVTEIAFASGSCFGKLKSGYWIALYNEGYKVK